MLGSPEFTVILSNYSMILATLPEPTVLPHPHVATACYFASQTMIKWGFFYLYYPQYLLIFLIIENFRSILEARDIFVNI